jgi:hypothetical protein
MRVVDIAEAGNLSIGHLNRLMYGATVKQCAEDTAAALLAVQARPDSVFTDAVGVRRRIRALCRAGWEQKEMAARTGYGAAVWSMWANAAQVHKATRELVAAVYDDLSTQEGGSGRATRWAQRRGWHPPEAWSDATIDDPRAEPYDWCRDDVDEVALQQVEAGVRRWGGLTGAEQRELVHRHLGRSRPSTLAARWGTTRARIEKLAADGAPVREVA